MSDLDAGRELDALVAERVMGWQWNDYTVNYGNDDYRTVRGLFDVKGSFDSHDRFPEYSTDIAAAWRVVEKLKPDWAIRIEVRPSGVYCDIISLTERRVEKVTESSVPLAICRAALRAVTGAGQ
jgi:hypothetical protein